MATGEARQGACRRPFMVLAVEGVGLFTCMCVYKEFIVYIDACKRGHLLCC